MVVSNIFYFHPGFFWGNDPFWLAHIFIHGLVQPPTSDTRLQTAWFQLLDTFGFGGDYPSQSSSEQGEPGSLGYGRYCPDNFSNHKKTPRFRSGKISAAYQIGAVEVEANLGNGWVHGCWPVVDPVVVFEGVGYMKHYETTSWEYSKNMCFMNILENVVWVCSCWFQLTWTFLEWFFTIWGLGGWGDVGQPCASTWINLVGKFISLLSQFTEVSVGWMLFPTPGVIFSKTAQSLKLKIEDIWWCFDYIRGMCGL